MTVEAFMGTFRFLSNFYVSPLSLWGESWRSAEHAYQAAKTEVPEERRLIRDSATPSAAKRFGRGVTLRADWDEVKVAVMDEVLRAKFSTPELEHALRATEDALLVEGNYWHDNFWGSCGCSRCADKGANMLGQALMRLRATFQEAGVE